MTDLIVLIWLTMNAQTSEIIGPEMSERYFETHAECALFMNTIARKPIVDENYEFRFATPQGIFFMGGCYNAEEYLKIFRKESE